MTYTCVKHFQAIHMSFYISIHICMYLYTVFHFIVALFISVADIRQIRKAVICKPSESTRRSRLIAFTHSFIHTIIQPFISSYASKHTHTYAHRLHGSMHLNDCE